LVSLAGERLVLVPEGTITGAVIGRALTQAGVVPHVVMTIASTEALCEAVQRGLGITVLPDSYRVRATYRLCSVPLKEPTPVRDVGLLMPADEMASPAARAFRALLVEHTRERS
jgi:DNA-binding transcriptional LysR family regulator